MVRSGQLHRFGAWAARYLDDVCQPALSTWGCSLAAKSPVLQPRRPFCAQARWHQTRFGEFRRGVHSSSIGLGLPPHTVLEMPALSPTMEAGNLVEWKVKEGDEVSSGDVLAEIETDKASLAWDTQDDGVIAKVLVPNGTNDLSIGHPLAVMVDDASDVAAFADYKPSGTPAPSEPTDAADANDSAADAGTAPAFDGPQSDRLGPAARMALANSGLSVEDVRPTGPNNIVTKADVVALVASLAKSAADSDQAPPRAAPDADGAAKAAPAPPADKAAAPEAAAPAASTGGAPGRVSRGSERYTDVPVSTMRRVIAKRLLESKLTIPAIYVAGHAKLDALTHLRGVLKQAGVRASVNDFVLKATAAALRKVPAACAGWDASKEEAVQYDDVDISVAVATEGGLITPIVKAVDSLSVADISAAVRDLAGRARENKLAPHEFTGGSFTISNLGMFGIKDFSAIINPPQACILAVGGPQSRVTLQSGRPEAESYMTVTLSADSRVVDEETAATFLESFAHHVENPALLLA